MEGDTLGLESAEVKKAIQESKNHVVDQDVLKGVIRHEFVRQDHNEKMSILDKKIEHSASIESLQSEIHSMSGVTSRKPSKFNEEKRAKFKARYRQDGRSIDS